MKNKFNDFYPKLAFAFVSGICGTLALSILLLFITSHFFPGLDISILTTIFVILIFPVMHTWSYFKDPIDEAKKSVHSYLKRDDIKNEIQPLLKHIESSPEVGVYQSDEINAFAVSAIYGNNSLIAFSSASVAQLSQNQFMALAAHEVAHIKNDDTHSKAIIIVFHQIINFYPLLIAQITKESLSSRILNFSILLIIMLAIYAGSSSVVIFTLLAKPLAVILGCIAFPYALNRLTDALFYAYSRQREYAADNLAAEMTSFDDVTKLLEQLTHDGVATKTGFFDTHPPYKERIKHLAEYFSHNEKKKL